MVKIEIISREVIKPSTPTPNHLRTFRLSLLDQFIPPSATFPAILYYSYDQTSNLNQSEMSYRLKESASNALTLYYPFAGRMKDDSSVDCNDQGVDYFEARVDTGLSEVIESPQVEVLSEFVPSMNRGSDQESGDCLLLAIQVNLFSCGRIAIGMCISHRIADACTLSTFIKYWAAMARGDETGLVSPIFVASSLFPPKEPLGYEPENGNPNRKAVSKRFCFSGSKIAALRAEVLPTTGSSTRVEVVTAAILKSAMARMGADQRRSSMLTHPVNIRKRMDPPLTEYAFGNLVRTPYVFTDSGMDLGSLVLKLREGMGKIDIENLRQFQGENAHAVVKSNLKRVGELRSNKELDFFMFSSWCRFPIYEADFGWGKPVWVSFASRDDKNSIFLMDSMSDDGGIEAWITMDEEDMMKFEQVPQLLALVS